MARAVARTVMGVFRMELEHARPCAALLVVATLLLASSAPGVASRARLTGDLIAVAKGANCERREVYRGALCVAVR